MKHLKMNRTIFALLTTASLIAAAQPAPVPPPPGEKPITPNKRASCEEQRRKGRYNIYFDKVEIEKLVQTVAYVTCRTFILP